MAATVSEIAGGPLDSPPPLVKGVGTKTLGKGRVKWPKSQFSSLKVPIKIVEWMGWG